MSDRDGESRRILDLRVDATTYADAARWIITRARHGQPGYVCAANVHMTMEAFDDPSFRDVVNGADLVVPDGMPLVWGLRALGVPGATRVYGPTLMLHVCEQARMASVSIGLYGSTERVLTDLVGALERRFPGLSIDCAISPPFRELRSQEDRDFIQKINASGVRVLFVGLGCPKQERWMAAHAERLVPVLIGVGAAFDFHAGHLAQAPAWVQGLGLEWLYRLAMEPRRLWARYLVHNPRFVLAFGKQLLLGRSGPRPSATG